MRVETLVATMLPLERIRFSVQIDGDVIPLFALS